VDLEGIVKYEGKGDDRYFIVELLGKIEGEHQDRCHLLPCTCITQSGIRVKEWVKALIQEEKTQGHVDGPLFTDRDTVIMSTHALDDMLTELLEEIYDTNLRLLPMSVTSREDINGSYQVFRTFQRLTGTRALEQQVSAKMI
jgi:hypothetical protein